MMKMCGRFIWRSKSQHITKHEHLVIFSSFKHSFTISRSMGFNFNSLPNDKIQDWLKLKAFADNKITVIEKLKIVLGRVENIVGKGENAGYQHFLLFPQCFQKTSFPRLLKVRMCGKELN